MEAIGTLLQRQGWVLRSGGAKGADSAFERGAERAAMEDGVPCLKEIYVPWVGYQGRSHREPGVIVASELAKAREAIAIARRFHPAWEQLSDGARRLHGRNSHQILGQTLDCPASIVICWTKDGDVVGGTGQSLRLAAAYDVPVVNLGDVRWRNVTPEAIVAEVIALASHRRDVREGMPLQASTSPSP